MMEMSRRSFVMTAATATAAFGVAGPVEFLPSALAQGAPNPLNPKGVTSHKFKVGSAEVTTVFEGAGIRDLPADFVKNATVDDMNASLKAAGFQEGKLPNTFTMTVVKVGNRTVLFDSGFGPNGPAGTGQFAANLTAAGIDPATIDAIVMTHFHPDHLFGLFTKENAPLFPKAEILAPEAELKYWADPALLTSLPEARRPIPQRVQDHLVKWSQLKRTAPDTDVLPGIRAVATHGHTPGHTSYIVDGGGGAQLLVLGDVTNIPPMNVRNPGWHVVFDQDAQAAEATRRRIFDRAIADKLVCSGYHWGMPGAGTLAKDGNTYAIVPVA